MRETRKGIFFWVSLTIAGWLMIWRFEAEGIAPGLVPLRIRGTAFGNFQTAILSKPVCDDSHRFKAKAEFMTDVMDSNVYCDYP